MPNAWSDSSSSYNPFVVTRICRIFCQLVDSPSETDPFLTAVVRRITSSDQLGISMEDTIHLMMSYLLDFLRSAHSYSKYEYEELVGSL